MDLIYYLTILIILIILLLLITLLYVKIKYNFWSKQPVFHYYDLLYWLKPSGIINDEPPLTNKFCNFKNINNFEHSKLTQLNKQYIVNFLRTNYLRNKYANYLPTENSFNSYFENNVFNSYVSIYSEDKILIDYSNQNEINTKEIIAVITGRPLYVTLNEKSFPVYYVDNLCVHPLYRNKNIAPQMIQTHEWFQRQNNKKIKISLFKREGQLTGIVPLTVYNTNAYRKLTVYRLHDPKLSVVLITKSTLHLLMEFIKDNTKKFDCTITPHIANFAHLINNKIFYVYILKSNDTIMACYFFKNTFSTYYNKPIIELTSSISNCPYAEIFYNGFTNAYYHVCREIKTKIIIIENISHNDIMINRIHKTPLEISPTAFFLYNYVSYSIKPNKFFCIY